MREPAILAAIASLMFVSACAGSPERGRVARIELDENVGDAGARDLTRRARAGDGVAQLELGTRYEEGRGVPVDWIRAALLYRMAATANPGVTYIYSPPVTLGGSGRVIPVGRGPRRQGLPEARVRLEALMARIRARSAVPAPNPPPPPSTG